MAGQHNRNAWGARLKWVFIAFAAIGGFFLLAEHRAHAVPFLPWLFLAACPLMHLFMHHGHGHQDHDRRNRGSAVGRPPAAAGPGAPTAPAPGDKGHRT